MDRKVIYEQINRVLCKEFQSIWLINSTDLSLEIIASNEKEMIEGGADTASEIKDYEAARLWYIEHYVVEHSKKRMLEQTKLEYVLEVAKADKLFVIDYGRMNDGKMNYNQICYNVIYNPFTDTPEYILMGFRELHMSSNIGFDPMTGLQNRIMFFTKAEELLLENPDVQYDIELSDIPDFKKINEIYGIAEADRLLKFIAHFLLTHLDGDFLIGRYGGDQFAVMGPSHRMREILDPELFDGFLNTINEADVPSCEMKFGIYENIPHDKSIVSSCDKAHVALNSIKGIYGKRIAYYNEVIESRLGVQRKIESSMRDAIKNDQFKVYYQPKHSAKTGELIGAEALIRWIHPEYGFMSPGDFIPQFERNGFVVEMDRYVWRRTCKNLRRWIDKGIDIVPVSVNASRLTMIKDELVEEMDESIKLFGLQPEMLHIEVTETLMTGNIDQLVGNVIKIREMGCKVELDDFGSGYSSLNILSTFPIDILKLDMSFLQQFGDKKRSVVLESCIDMARKLGFETVSEGVELEEQKELLKALGVDIIQGYYYSKPLPEDEFEQYLMECC